MPMPIVSTVVQEEAAAATYLEAISPRTDTVSSRKRRRTTSATIASAKPTAAGADCASIKQPALPARCGRTAPPATPFRTAPVPTACASNVTPTDAPSATPSVSLTPTAPAPAPSESPSEHAPSPTGSPVKPVNACLGKCNGDYPFGCNDTVDADRLYCGTNGGGCSYLSGIEQPPSGYCLFKGRAPTTATPTASPSESPSEHAPSPTGSPVKPVNACLG